ncbi:hypothetical protein JCM16303_000667 [Sporobolomyces ruberrimus]
MSTSMGIEPSPLASSTAASASPTIATPSEPGTKPPTSRATAPTTTANGTATTQDGSTTSRPPAPPLEDQEMLAFGTVAEQEILPPPPRDPNAPLVGQDIPGDAANAAATGTKRSMGTGAAAAGPLARAKRPKNVKFSPAKVGKQLARRAAAPGAAGAEVVLANNDYCDSCGGKGHFLCCEGGCLRSFHFGCLEPPLEIDEVPEESWFCKACRAKAHPPPRLPPGFFSELIFNVERENPKAFQLSTDLKQFYKNVAVGLNGEFIDSNEHRPPSKITGRAVGQEDRDGYRLKDKNGRPIICYNCSQAANPHIHRRIISCDFCDQHWHLDCLNPPMTGMPPPTRKWMCPVHSEHVLPKKRVPRQTSVVNLEERGVPNNGDIIVAPPPERPPPEEYEEMTVNRIRYQVPEQNIILDFWGKVASSSKRNGDSSRRSKKRASPRKKRSGANGYESGNSSPLTDLTSSEEDDHEMGEARSSRKSKDRSGSTPSTSTPSLLDNLALLAEVRYIDLLNKVPEPSSSNLATKSPSPSSQNGSGPSPSLPVASASSAAPNVPLSSIPPSSASAKAVAVASPTSASVPLGSGTPARTASPSLSPAPVGATPSRAPGPSSELTVQSKEDLKALMQVRKMLLSSGQAPGSAKTTMLSFLEGAPIIPKLAFVNNGKTSSWTRPWEGKKDGARPSGSGQPSTPGTAAAPSASSLHAASPAPLSAPPSDAAPKTASSVSGATAGTPANNGDAVAPGGQRTATLPSKRPAAAGPTSPALSASSALKPPPAHPLAPLPPSSRPSHSPVLATHQIPTPYSSDMPFQLPAFRPPSATPTPRPDSMEIDSENKK